MSGVISVHLHTDTALGALNLHTEQVCEYDEFDLAAATLVAAHASVVLAHTQTTQQLHRAMETRLDRTGAGHPDDPPRLDRAHLLDHCPQFVANTPSGSMPRSSTPTSSNLAGTL